MSTEYQKFYALKNIKKAESKAKTVNTAFIDAMATLDNLFLSPIWNGNLFTNEAVDTFDPATRSTLGVGFIGISTIISSIYLAVSYVRKADYRHFNTTEFLIKYIAKLNENQGMANILDEALFPQLMPELESTATDNMVLQEGNDFALMALLESYCAFEKVYHHRHDNRIIATVKKRIFHKNKIIHPLNAEIRYKNIINALYKVFLEEIEFDYKLNERQKEKYFNAWLEEQLKIIHLRITYLLLARLQALCNEIYGYNQYLVGYKLSKNIKKKLFPKIYIRPINKIKSNHKDFNFIETYFNKLTKTKLGILTNTLWHFLGQYSMNFWMIVGLFWLATGVKLSFAGVSMILGFGLPLLVPVFLVSAMSLSFISKKIIETHYPDKYRSRHAKEKEKSREIHHALSRAYAANLILLKSQLEFVQQLQEISAPINIINLARQPLEVENIETVHSYPLPKPARRLQSRYKHGLNITYGAITGFVEGYTLAYFGAWIIPILLPGLGFISASVFTGGIAVAATFAICVTLGIYLAAHRATNASIEFKKNRSLTQDKIDLLNQFSLLERENHILHQEISGISLPPDMLQSLHFWKCFRTRPLNNAEVVKGRIKTASWSSFYLITHSWMGSLLGRTMLFGVLTATIGSVTLLPHISLPMIATICISMAAVWGLYKLTEYYHNEHTKKAVETVKEMEARVFVFKKENALLKRKQTCLQRLSLFPSSALNRSAMRCNHGLRTSF